MFIKKYVNILSDIFIKSNNTKMFFYVKIVLKNLLASSCQMLYNRYSSSAPVAQWIEHWPPEPSAQVQILSGAFIFFYNYNSLNLDFF